MAHILNLMMPMWVPDVLRRCAGATIPSMRHLDMRARLPHLAKLGLKPGVIIDVGAARGNWARMAAKIWPDARIFGVGPNENRVGMLEQTKRDLGRFDYWRGFLGPEGRTVKYADRDVQTSLLDANANHQGLAIAEMVTLDQLVEQFKLPAPGLIKLDVQGFELEVLKGASKALRDCQAVLMEVSFFQLFPQMPTVDEVIRFMTASGFAWYDVTGIYRREHDDALRQMDLMFLRSDHALRNSNAM
jgi:FkbM family methyltransferase